MSGKGDKRRPGKPGAYSDNMERIMAAADRRSAEIDTLIGEMREGGQTAEEISAVILDRYGETYVLKD